MMPYLELTGVPITLVCGDLVVIVGDNATVTAEPIPGLDLRLAGSRVFHSELVAQLRRGAL